jgi:nucleoid DNA-binding protein
MPHNVLKQDLIIRAAGRVDITQAKAKEVLEGILADITDALTKGDEVTLTGFGKFSTKTTSARVGRNPITGESLNIPTKRKVVFKVMKALKDAIQ